MNESKQENFSEIRNYQGISRDRYIKVARYATGTNFQLRFDSVVIAQEETALTITFEPTQSENIGILTIKYRNPDIKKRNETLNDLERIVLGPDK